MGSAQWFNADVLYFWGLGNMILHVAYLGYWFFKLRSKPYVIKHSAEAYGLS